MRSIFGSIIAVVVLASIALAGEVRTTLAPSDAPSRAATFEDVEGTEELRQLVNKNGGMTRLILLLSPT